MEQRLALRHDQEICFGSKLDSEKEYGFLLPRTTQTQRSISLVTITERIQLLHRVSLGFRRYRGYRESLFDTVHTVLPSIQRVRYREFTVRVEPWRSWVSVSLADVRTLTTAFKWPRSPGILLERERAGFCLVLGVGAVRFS